MNWRDQHALKEEFDNIILSPLTEDVINRCLHIIEKMGPYDDEVAHSMEKQLWNKTLEQLAISNPIAQQVLKTKEIKFSRWFA